jgi:hypothetical protein
MVLPICIRHIVDPYHIDAVPAPAPEKTILVPPLVSIL